MSKPMSVTEEFAHNTVRIECTRPDGTKSVGTGFFVLFPAGDSQSVPLIVTNQHVVDNSVACSLAFTRADPNGAPLRGQMVTFGLQGPQQNWVNHPEPGIDLCAMPLAPLLHVAIAQGTPIFFKAFSPENFASKELLGELTAVEPILMVGYPVGLWDSINNMPIFRQGITATHPNVDYLGQKEFLIDAACFPGSSGSPVLLFQTGGYSDRSGNIYLNGSRFALLGVLYAGPQFTTSGEIKVVQIPTDHKPIPVTNVPMNLGNVIKVEKLDAFRVMFAPKG